MKHRRFHKGEEVRVGPQAYDRRMIGRVCRIESVKPPIEGEWRYLVTTESGLSSILLECTLRKQYERGDWRDMAYFFWPKREAR
jgi:hypothetical protein